MSNPRGRPNSRRDRCGRFAPEMTPAERDLAELAKGVERAQRDYARLHARIERRIRYHERKLAAARAKIAARNDNGA